MSGPETIEKAVADSLAALVPTDPKAAAVPSPRPSGLVVLPHRQNFQKILANIQRSPDLIEPDLRTLINRLIHGNEPWPLTMHGPAGTGKTCAALCILDYSGGLYFTVPELLETLIECQQGRHADGVGDKIWPAKFWSYISAAPLVVLDEIGCREKVSDAHYEGVKRLLELRVGKPLVAISNLGMEEICRIYDERISSRLSAGTLIEMDGDDRRLR